MTCAKGGVRAGVVDGAVSAVARDIRTWLRRKFACGRRMLDVERSTKAVELPAVSDPLVSRLKNLIVTTLKLDGVRPEDIPDDEIFIGSPRFGRRISRPATADRDLDEADFAFERNQFITDVL